MCTHLAKRGDTYYFRRRVPDHLQAHFNKTAIFESLKTKDRREAVVLCRAKGLEWDERFAEAEGKPARAPSGRSPVILSHITSPHDNAQERVAIASWAAVGPVGGCFIPPPRPVFESEEDEGRWRKKCDDLERDYWDEWQRVSDEEAGRELHELELHEEQERRNQAERDRLIWLFRRRADGDFDVISAEDAQVVEAMMRIHLESPCALPDPLQILNDVRLGHVAKGAHFTGSPGAARLASDARASLGSVLKRWSAETQPTSKYVLKMERVLRVLKESTGIDSLGITRQDVISFKDTLLERGQSPANINQYLTVLRALLGFAHRNGLIDANPATGIHISETTRAKEKRLPFSVDALQVIFSGPVHAEGHRPKGGGGEASYWLPLLALYSGARIEELAQLHPDDVVEEAYRDADGNDGSAWVISITDRGEGQSLKNASSRRRVPVHEDLIRLGFIKHVLAMKTEGRGRIFWRLRPDSHGSESGNFSKWFGRYLRTELKITDERMVFHSFRHCFKEYAREAEISSEVHNALSGHSAGDTAENYGSESYPIRPLVAAMRRYSIPLPAREVIFAGRG